MNTERTQLHRALAATIWEASRADEGTISYTGANHVADALIDGPLAGLLAEVERLSDQAETSANHEMKLRNRLIEGLRKATTECDALRAQLSEADQFAGELSAQVAAVAALMVDSEADYLSPGVLHPMGARVYVRDLRAALSDPDQALNRVRAEAWDEGFEHGADVSNSDRGQRDNPYREQEEA